MPTDLFNLSLRESDFWVVVFIVNSVVLSSSLVDSSCWLEIAGSFVIVTTFRLRSAEECECPLKPIPSLVEINFVLIKCKSSL